MESQEELVYGSECGETTHEGSTGSHDVMSEKVENLARDIYAEFERMMEKYDSEVVKNLMPLVVNVLESLDLAGIENQEHQVELELVKEDNEQLVTQYEREKCLRKNAEQRLLEMEYSSEEDKNELISKIESIESIVRMLEMKSKNTTDHATRLEDKEAEMKKEYTKLHDRYTELFKTHFDYMEKTKILFGAQQNKQATTPVDTTRRFAEVPSDIRSPEDIQRGWNLEQFSPDKDLSMSEALSSDSTVVEPIVSDHTKVRRPNTLYQECKFTEEEKKEEEPFDSCTVSDNIFGMGKEVENIIMENIELLATKNALNIVKDDLIARVDHLTSEKDILENQIKQMETQRDVNREKMDTLEQEVKKLKEELERIQVERESDDVAVPMAQRKRFTRVEMARVLMERNQYKEKLMELQDAVRWSETLKATKITEGYSEKPSGGGIFKFFSNLFTSEKNKGSSQISSSGAGKENPRTGSKTNLQNIKLKDGISERKAKERRDQLKKVKAHVAKDDVGRVQAYGWSLPTASGQNPLESVPVPVFCRPLDQSDPNPQLKVWCAAGVDLNGGGGTSCTGGLIDPSAELALSSLVWICSGIHNRFSQVSVIDANNPADVLQTFKIGSSLILCISSVPGIKDNDLSCDETYLNKCITVEEAPLPDGIITKQDQGLNAVSEITESIKQEEKLSSPDPEEGMEPLTCAEGGTEESEVPSTDIMSTVLPTMWLGAQNGFLYVHSSKADWSTCILKVKLSDCVLAIVHHRGRVFCSLANGNLVVFHRNPVTKEFDLSSYREISISSPDNHAIRCLAVILGEKMWCGYRNSMAVLNPETLEVESTFSVHPRKESQVRQMAHVGEGVWITIRLDSTFRLYHARTHAHLQDVDIEPMISRMIGTGKLGFSFVRITCIGITCNRLWIGTGNGVILSLPLFLAGFGSQQGNQPLRNRLTSAQSLPEVSSMCRSEGLHMMPSSPSQSEQVSQDVPPDEGPTSQPIDSSGPASLGAVPTSSTAEPSIRPIPHLPGSCVRIDDLTIPYCNMTQAQLSFHGHKDSVRFILGVPGTGGMISTTSPAANAEGGTTPPARCMFVLSGGEGYVDLRIGEENSGGETLSEKSDLSHLIVWEVAL